MALRARRNPSFKAWLPRLGLPWWLSGKEPACQCRRCGFKPWVRKIPAEGKGNPLQYSGLENPMDRGAWQVAVCTESDMTEAAWRQQQQQQDTIEPAPSAFLPRLLTLTLTLTCYLLGLLLLSPCFPGAFYY